MVIKVIALLAFVWSVLPISTFGDAERSEEIGICQTKEIHLFGAVSRTSIAVIIVTIVTPFAKLGLIVSIPTLVAQSREAQVKHRTDEIILDLTILITTISIVSIPVVTVFSQVLVAIPAQSVINSFANRRESFKRMTSPT